MADLASMLRSGGRENLLPVPLTPLPSEAADSAYGAADVRRARQREQFIKQFGIDPEAPDFQRQVRGNFESQAIPQIAFTAAGPLAGPAGRGLSTFLRSGPGKAVIGAGGVAAAASEASPAEQATDPGSLQSLMADRATVQRQAEEARARREQERRTGRGPNYDAADAEFKRISDQLSGLDALISSEQRRNSPEARLAAEQARILAAEENRKREANTPFQELHPGWANALPYISGVAALGLGALAKGRNVRAYNTEIGDLSNRWQGAVQRAQAGRPGPTQQRSIAEAQGLGTQFETLKAAGPSKAGQALPGAVVGELSQLYPLYSDYSRSLPGSELRQRTEHSMEDPKAVGMRMLQGLAYGWGGSKLGAALKGGKLTPPGFRAETDALRPLALPPATPPPAPPALSGPSPQPLLPAPAGGFPNTPQPPQGPPTGPASSTSLSSLLRTPTQGQLPAPPASTTLPRPQEPIVGGSHPDHSWNAAAGRWQDANGRFLSGKPPKRRNWDDYPDE